MAGRGPFRSRTMDGPPDRWRRRGVLDADAGHRLRHRPAPIRASCWLTLTLVILGELPFSFVLFFFAVGKCLYCVMDVGLPIGGSIGSFRADRISNAFFENFITDRFPWNIGCSDQGRCTSESGFRFYYGVIFFIFDLSDVSQRSRWTISQLRIMIGARLFKIQLDVAFFVTGPLAWYFYFLVFGSAFLFADLQTLSTWQLNSKKFASRFIQSRQKHQIPWICPPFYV